MGWLGAYNNTTAFLLPLMEDKFFGPYQNKRYQELLRLAAAGKNIVARLPFYQRAEHQLAYDLPVIPVLYPSITTLVSPQIGGYYTTNPEGWVLSKNIYRITEY